MVELIDTHCHIQSAGVSRGEKSTWELWAKAPDRQPEAIIADALTAGVTRMLCVGCSLEDSELAIDFVKDRPNCAATIGIHPHEAQQYAGKNQLLNRFSALATANKVVAIGECGLDYYYEHSLKDVQRDLLHFQIQLALEHDLPIIFHVRDAFDDFWPIFEHYSGIRGVLHSFTDTQASLDRALKHGLFIGVNGISTFAKDADQQAMYRAVPLNKLLLETDAPYLTPTPYRGKICEPYHIRVIAEYLCLHRNESLERLAEATTNNARQLFGII